MRGGTLLLVALLLITVFIVWPKQARAQYACDACGLCQTSTAVPGNWASCAKCMYDYTGAAPTFPMQSSFTTLNAAATKQKSYTALGCIDASPAKFSEFIMRLMANLITGIGVLGLVYGGLKVMMARGDTNAIQEGKMYVISSIAAILIVNFAALIVKFAGKDILQLPFFK